MSILVEKQSGYQDKDDLKERIHKLIQNCDPAQAKNQEMVTTTTASFKRKQQDSLDEFH